MSRNAEFAEAAQLMARWREQGGPQPFLRGQPICPSCNTRIGDDDMQATVLWGGSSDEQWHRDCADSECRQDFFETTELPDRTVYHSSTPGGYDGERIR